MGRRGQGIETPLSPLNAVCRNIGPVTLCLAAPTLSFGTILKPWEHIMVRNVTLALMLSGSALVSAAPALAQEPAPVSKLVEAVNIPHEKFTLPNGLTVLVHEDR